MKMMFQCQLGTCDLVASCTDDQPLGSLLGRDIGTVAPCFPAKSFNVDSVCAA